MIITIPVRHRTETRILVALRPCAAKFLARQLHVVEKIFFSESCVRTQPKHPRDRAARRSSHTIKNFFCATSFAGYQSDWPTSRKLANRARTRTRSACLIGVRAPIKHTPAFPIRKVLSQIRAERSMCHLAWPVRNSVFPELRNSYFLSKKIRVS